MTPWTVAHQVPLSMEFLGQEYWSRWPFSSPGDPLDPGFEPGFPALQADSLPGSYMDTIVWIFVPLTPQIHMLKS